MPPTEADKKLITEQGFPEEALNDPTFIEAISRPVKPLKVKLKEIYNEDE